jgi:hypothetical protein
LIHVNGTLELGDLRFQRRQLLPRACQNGRLHIEFFPGHEIHARQRRRQGSVEVVAQVVLDLTETGWEAKDRAGLERLLRYCARPVFASVRLSWVREGERLRYQLPKPRADGQSVLELTPFELLDRLAVLIPPPRRHRHRYHGVLAPVCPQGATRACVRS